MISIPVIGRQVCRATVGISLLLLSVVARADLMLAPGGEAYYGTGAGGACYGIPEPTNCDGPGTSHVLAWLDANIAGFDSSKELYKSDVTSGGGSAESGPFNSSYNTSYNGDQSGASIVWLESAKIADPSWLFIKDGNNAPVWYLFDISGWDGMETIKLSGFWPGRGAISHVSIYGGGGTTKVPEPATLALLGAGLFGLGLARRRRRA